MAAALIQNNPFLEVRFKALQGPAQGHVLQPSLGSPGGRILRAVRAQGSRSSASGQPEP